MLEAPVYLMISFLFCYGDKLFIRKVMFIRRMGVPFPCTWEELYVDMDLHVYYESILDLQTTHHYPTLQ